MSKKSSEPSFEDDLEALDAVVEDLESGELGLDASLQRFEEGVQLARRLRKRLDDAEGRVEELLADGSTRSLDVE
ncbi:MAG TPA: exodeoxyribonuclease VII small subunit [Candidatus Thermoplasmatota archaeon]|nr:exodeoxyribonuclease VII small subunit [Candidatus Thermoplasmatota archaeon]